MRLYLSSYEFGNQPEAMFKLLKSHEKKVAIITNAVDLYPEDGIVQRLKNDIERFSEYGMSAERLDLRKYFGKSQELSRNMSKYGLVWVKGGNTYLLRVAMKLSGFDEYLKVALQNDSIVYAGFSAGCCVLSPSLEGFDIVDDPKVVNQVYREPADYSGLSILDFHFEPHYKSDHPESAEVDLELEYLEKQGIPYRTFRDGEALVINGDKVELVG